uniref:AIR synthase related protein, N-terminal domain n=1 Tax=Candidatus Kentrum sp. TUN TaxID=2126343 RepID=A0A450ZL76_9GAMM|nr:MAG: AIR synthase related protein, N-terminal domain [Candidatus Kentron sp. TUN]VFK56832.1 MAG: AIR synthase related protein, N-terminal domain [Candidatus Kentron sp. TUN]VFK57461.1 MAG: AIR synthase related protein, N-terminal domain [Candidatus Kentron sp. TUN]
MHEFDLIRHFFSTGTTQREDVILGIGDDAALLRVPPNREIVTAITTIRDSQYKTSPELLGHHALSLSLRRLVDLGAMPAWVTLALTMPNVDEDWLARFSFSIKDLAMRSHVCLIGGDTTQGPLAITMISNGYIPISD